MNKKKKKRIIVTARGADIKIWEGYVCPDGSLAIGVSPYYSDLISTELEYKVYELDEDGQPVRRDKCIFNSFESILKKYPKREYHIIDMKKEEWK